MQSSNSSHAAVKPTPSEGILEAVSALKRLSSLQGPYTHNIDPERSRRLLIAALRLLTADGDRGDRARHALRQLATAARELLALLEEENSGVADV